MKEALEHKIVPLTEYPPREPAMSSTVGSGSRDLRALGKLSVFIIKIILCSAKACFIPTVKAAPPTKEPTKPAPMRYKDLPVYDCPHFTFKDHIEQQVFRNPKCPDKKILQSMLLPYVNKYRKEACQIISTVKSEVKGFCCDAKNRVCTTAKETKAYCRSPSHETERKAIMGTAPIVGGLLARGGKPTRLFGATAAAAAAGALCFPEQTDKVFRKVLVTAASQFLVVLNFYCDKNVMIKRASCPAEYPKMPPPPKKPMDNKCK